MSKAAKLHKDFFGREAASEFEIDLGEFKELTQLGKVHAIEYKARKHKDKQQQIYRHTFKCNPLLLSNGKDIIIYGKFKITERGIEG
jgi:hypothetical protein